MLYVGIIITLYRFQFRDMNNKNRHHLSDMTDILRKAGLRPSPQRAAIAGYIDASRCHPSAEEIYKALVPEYPTLSLTTVYNTLYALEKAGLARILDIESRNVRFDTASTANHAHILCRECGQIFDMPLPQDIEEHMPAGFRIDSVNLYFKGLCPSCVSATFENETQK